MIYHVSQTYQGGDLESSATQMGESEAIEAFCEKWDNADASLAVYHVNYIHCHDTIEQAREFAEEFGGNVFAIDADAMADDYIEIERDTLEYDHPIIRDEIPAEFITIVA